VGERSYLNDSFKYTAGGLLVTAVTARQIFRSGFVFRLMSANPCECLVPSHLAGTHLRFRDGSGS